VLQHDANIPFTLEHDENRVLATTRSKRLKLAEDTKGLAVEADLPDTTLARDLHALVEADVVDGHVVRVRHRDPGQPPDRAPSATAATARSSASKSF
jgi:HK97 family phage prohead protease